MAKKFKGKRRKSSRKRRKGLPLASGACRTTALAASGVDLPDGVVQVNKLLSVLNNRLYRQGMNYDVSFSLLDPLSDEQERFKFYTLPNNWFVRGAISHAFRQYRAAMQPELLITGGKTSKWHDFVIDHQDPDGSRGIMYPSIFDGDSFAAQTAGLSSDLSKVTNAAGTENQFHIGGALTNSFSILEEYALHLMSRRADDSAESGPQSYEGLQTGGTDIDHLMEQGDVPPYDEDFSFWHGGADADTDFCMVYQDCLYVGATRTIHDPDGSTTSDVDTVVASGSRVQTRTFTAPLGLVWVESASNIHSGTTTPNFAMHVKAGNYKGVSAQPIYRYQMLGATAKSLR